MPSPSAPTSNPPTITPPLLGAAWPLRYARWLARIAWVAVALVTLTIVAVSIPVFFETTQTVCATDACLDFQLTPDDLRLLNRFGLSTTAYAAVVTAVTTAMAAIWLAVGGVLFWRKSDDPPALLAAFCQMTFPTDMSATLKATQPAWSSLVNAVDYLGIVATVIFLYVFPDGRFVPRWTRWLALGWIVIWTPGYYLGTGSVLDSDTWPPALIFLVLSLWIGSSIGAQVYRYQRVASPRQRQQSNLNRRRHPAGRAV